MTVWKKEFAWIVKLKNQFLNFTKEKRNGICVAVKNAITKNFNRKQEKKILEDLKKDIDHNMVLKKETHLGIKEQKEGTLELKENKITKKERLHFMQINVLFVFKKKTSIPIILILTEKITLFRISCYYAINATKKCIYYLRKILTMNNPLLSYAFLINGVN